MMRWLRPVAWAAAVSLAAASLPAAAGKKKKKKDEEPVTQTLELPKEPPAAVIADASRLVFHVSALSARGLLSQQVRDALKDLQRQTRGATVVKLRAFVAGSGDMRRVQAIVSETFTQRHQPLPALSVVQVGGLPLGNAQVVLESIAVAKKPVNPHGLAFVSGQRESAANPLAPAAPLVDKALASLETAVRAAGSEAGDVARLTCYVSTLADVNTVRASLARAFPKAAWNVVQAQRAPLGAIAECEVVARLRTPPGAPLRVLNPAGLPASPHYSQLALVGPGRLALSGSQMAFGYQDQDLRLAFQRLQKAMESVGASLAKTAMASIYPVSDRMTEQIRAIRAEFFGKARPPAVTLLGFEGLPSLDASCAVDVAAVLEN
jgi:enamine deaminase RidA (YjgF/YER057c/UK114 family)